MSKVLIDFRNVTKAYKLRTHGKLTLLKSFLMFLKGKKFYDDFIALDNVSFKVRKGETIGVIGRNGSGKTTLLKLISQITFPSSGKITLKEEVTPFLNMGVGFNDDLTATDNVMLYGSVMGIPRKKLKNKLCEIFEFAGVSKFQHEKLRGLSYGMKMRLSFSTMIRTKFGILLLDEIFAVGDKDFEKKSIAVFEKYKQEGKTIILVSHSLDIVKNFCERVIFLEKGKIIYDGKPEVAIEKYLKNGR